MPFLAQFIWAVLVSLVTRELFATGVDQTPLDPSGEADAPNIDEGATVPVIFGSVLTGRQSVSWYGGLNNEPIRQSGVTTGYKYSLTAQLSICMGPVDDVREIRFEDNVVEGATWTETTDYWDVAINSPDLFGGEDKEGGVVGNVRIYKGTTTQNPDVEMATLVNTALPAYRRVCYAMLHDCYIGTSSRLKSMSLLAERCPNGLGVLGGKHVVGSHRDSNVVCALYDVLTNPIWGAAVPTDQIDTAQWQAAALVAYDEGLGISVTLSSPGDLDSVVQGFLRYLDGVVYDDPATGLISIQLIREGDLSSALALTADEVSEVEISRISWVDLKSTVKVTWTNPERNYETGGVMAQNSAVVRALGGAVDLETIDSPGFTSAAVATEAATRSLRALSYPLSKVQVKGNRTLALLRVGKPFHLTWQRPSVSAYYRVTEVNFGSSGDPYPTVNAVEDVFAAAANTFTPPTSGGSGVVGAKALPISRAVLMETPYHLRRLDSRSAIFGAAAPNTYHTGYKVTGDDTLYGWMASGVLPADIPQWDGATLSSLTLAMTLPADIDSPSPSQVAAGEALLLVGTELLSYSGLSRSGGNVTFTGVTRGVLDTVPVAHTAGERAVVLATCRTRLNLNLASDAAVTVASRTFTAADAQPEAEASTRQITTASRALRPVPPGALRVGGVLWGAGPHADGVTVSWEPRTRQSTSIVTQTDTGLTAESSTDYLLRVYSGGTLVTTYTTSSTSQAIAESGSLVLTLHSRRGGLESLQGHRLAISVTAPSSYLLLETGDRLLLETGDGLVLEA